jgi:protoporphyrinogen/coproporphyrinogen III oxidase
LVCAWRLRQRGLPVLLLERGSRFGGVIDTVQENGFLFDIGPLSFTTTGPLDQLIAELGLAGELLFADRRAPRFILFRGRLVPMSPSPPALLRTPLIGWRTKLRLLTEPLRRTRPPQDDESVAAFVRRKFGADLLTDLAAPAISGIFAGDAEKLSLRSAFPNVHRWEEQYGSVLRGAMKSRPPSGAKAASLCTFRRGMRTLPQALCEKLADSAQCDSEVVFIRVNEAGHFDVALRHRGATQQLAASAVVIATPTDQAGTLLAEVNSRFADAFERIEYAGVAQVSAGYRLAQITGPIAARPQGFGFLVPRTEGLRLLGTIFSSFLFAGRAPVEPEPMASFTSFLGGATDPEMCKQPEDVIARIARAELAKVLGITGAPVAEHVSRWERALPQYNLGHGGIVTMLKQLCDKTPGLFLTGNYLSGPSIGSCVEQANQTAEAAARFLSARM